MPTKRKNKPKKKNKLKDTPKTERSLPEQKKTFNIIYTSAILVFFAAGILLLILSNSVFHSDVVVFISLGLMGLGIILLVQRSVYKQTAPTQKTNTDTKDEESLRLRPR